MNNTLPTGKIDRKFFFDTVRDSLFNGSFTPDQVKGIDAIIDTFETYKYKDKPLYRLTWLAYIFATAHHETGAKLVPVYENLNYSAQGLADTFPVRCAINPKARIKVPNAKALLIEKKPVKIANYVYANKNGNGNEASGDGWLFRGCGLPQTTGRNNFKWAGCEKDPTKMLDLEISVKAMFKGMIEGLYTNVKLEQFFNDTLDRPYEARRIINGLFRATLVEELHKKYLVALRWH